MSFYGSYYYNSRASANQGRPIWGAPPQQRAPVIAPPIAPTLTQRFAPVQNVVNTTFSRIVDPMVSLITRSQTAQSAGGLLSGTFPTVAPHVNPSPVAYGGPRTTGGFDASRIDFTQLDPRLVIPRALWFATQRGSLFNPIERLIPAGDAFTAGTRIAEGAVGKLSPLTLLMNLGGDTWQNAPIQPGSPADARRRVAAVAGPPRPVITPRFSPGRPKNSLHYVGMI